MFHGGLKVNIRGHWSPSPVFHSFWARLGLSFTKSIKCKSTVQQDRKTAVSVSHGIGKTGYQPFRLVTVPTTTYWLISCIQTDWLSCRCNGLCMCSVASMGVVKCSRQFTISGHTWSFTFVCAPKCVQSQDVRQSSAHDGCLTVTSRSSMSIISHTGPLLHCLSSALLLSR